MRSLDRLNFKINKSINSPVNLNYKLYGLYDLKTYNKGEVVKVEYYSSFVDDQYLDLILDETITYTKDELGFFKERISIVRWYLEDNSIGLSKEFIKKYNDIESVMEGINKRDNIIAYAKSLIISEIKKTYIGNNILTEAFNLLNVLGSDMSLYVEGNKQPLIDSINARTEDYIISIKTTLVSELTY